MQLHQRAHWLIASVLTPSSCLFGNQTWYLGLLIKPNISTCKRHRSSSAKASDWSQKDKTETPNWTTNHEKKKKKKRPSIWENRAPFRFRARRKGDCPHLFNPHHHQHIKLVYFSLRITKSLYCSYMCVSERAVAENQLELGKEQSFLISSTMYLLVDSASGLWVKALRRITRPERASMAAKTWTNRNKKGVLQGRELSRHFELLATSVSFGSSSCRIRTCMKHEVHRSSFQKVC